MDLFKQKTNFTLTLKKIIKEKNSKLVWTRARPHPSYTPNPKEGEEASKPNLKLGPSTCVNIIMCVKNIIFSFIIQSVQIKNSIICVINIIILL